MMKLLLKWALRIFAMVAPMAVTVTVAALWWGSRDTTIYASGFTDEAFERIQLGMAVEDIYSLLGRPLGVREEDSPERWCYGGDPMVRRGGAYIVGDLFRTFPCVTFTEAGVVLKATGDGMAVVDKGMTAEEVLQLLGEPDRRAPAATRTLHYSEPGGDGLFRARVVALDANNSVSDILTYQFYD
jgi:outer membrane protein assembly factor BamE (lipoprotein component of BamABCDE complex)